LDLVVGEAGLQPRQSCDKLICPELARLALRLLVSPLCEQALVGEAFLECDGVDLDAGEIQPIAVSLYLDRRLELLVGEPGVALLLAPIQLLGLLVLASGLGSSLADVGEEFVKLLLAKLEAESRLAVMHEVRPQHFAVAVGVEDLAGLLDRESGLVFDPHAALRVPL
jgi:hypothetical protein